MGESATALAFRFGWEHFGGVVLVGGPGDDLSQSRRLFENLKVLRKLQKMHYFRLFFKRFFNLTYSFSRGCTRNTGCSQGFDKTFKISH